MRLGQPTTPQAEDDDARAGLVRSLGGRKATDDRPQHLTDGSRTFDSVRGLCRAPAWRWTLVIV